MGSYVGKVSNRFMDPITKGEYPRTMRSLVRDRLPKFSAEQSMMVNGSFDFLGLNYYTTNYAADSPRLKLAKPSYLTDSTVTQTGNITYVYKQ